MMVSIVVERHSRETKIGAEPGEIVVTGWIMLARVAVTTNKHGSCRDLVLQFEYHILHAG